MIAFLFALALTQEPPPKPAIEAGYDGGFYVGGKDARLTMEGLLQVNARVFERDGPHETEFELRRMRLEFTGEFFDRWLFHIEPKFTAGEVELEEAWVGFKAGVHLFMFGRMKEPFSFEEMASQRHMDMLNFSVMNQFVPAEDTGVTIFGHFDILQYGFGFYNGNGDDDMTSDKDVALRLNLHPWRGLQFGGAFTVGRQNTDISGSELRTEARVPWAEYLPGTILEDTRVRLGAEAALLEGPFAFVAEYIYLREELNDIPVRFRGGYVQASYVLTGEPKRYKGDPIRIWKGVVPEKPFLRDPDIGAWQLVARVSRLALEDDLALFLTNFPKRVDSFTFGVNWYANEFVKVKVQYSRTQYQRSIVIDGNRHGNEDAVLFQFQVMF
jgi:phosphate-selective porin OprO and OprP